MARTFQCDKCGVVNIFVDGVDYCVICGCDVDFGEVIWGDEEPDDVY